QDRAVDVFCSLANEYDNFWSFHNDVPDFAIALPLRSALAQGPAHCFAHSTLVGRDRKVEEPNLESCRRTIHRALARLHNAVASRSGSASNQARETPDRAISQTLSKCATASTRMSPLSMV